MGFQNQSQNQPQPMGGGSNLERYEQQQGKAPAPGGGQQEQKGFIDHARDTLRGYRGGETSMNRTDRALAEIQGGSQPGGGQTINSGATGTPGMGAQAQQPQGPQVGYQNIPSTPDQKRQRIIDSVNAMNYHKMDPYTQKYYADQLGYDPQQMAQTFPAPPPQGVQVGGQVPMGGVIAGQGGY